MPIRTIGTAGGVLTSDSADAAPSDRKFFGSCLIFEAESLEAVRKHVEEDVYYKTGVVSLSAISTSFESNLTK
jgi:uncharacterized protein YciI